MPLKVLKGSKTRLSPILGPAERTKLTLAMFRDVLSALKKSEMIRSITVVSADATALEMARRFGADSILERRKEGLNRAIGLAIRKRNLHSSRALVIHADLPLLTARDVNRFLISSRDYPIGLAPSKDNSGTNALSLNPACIIRPAFGKESLNRHISIAEKRKLRYCVRRVKGLQFDVDDPEDMIELMHGKARRNTAKFLRTLSQPNLDTKSSTSR